MKLQRLAILALCTAAWTANAALACDGGAKGTSASAAATKSSCSAHATTATAAAGTGSHAAASCGMDPSKCTPEMQANCTAAMRAQCGKGTKATAANAKGAGCGMGTATAANAKGGSCCMGASAAANCDMKGVHGQCAVCSDEATCGDDLRSSGVRSQVVALRNGAMIVYAADTPEGVRALQTTVARYNDHIMSAYTSGSSSLCGGCKTFRGAMASGKFTRELVNVKNGCQILVTSSDKALVRRIHDMTGAQMASRERM